MRKHLLFFIVVLCMAGSLSAQKKDYVTVGLGVDYALLNDRAVGDVPMKSLMGSASMGFMHIGENNRWDVSLKGGFGFSNTYNFPSLSSRVADSYYFSLGGGYLHRVSDSAGKWRWYVGGKGEAMLYINQIVPFTNSEANYFFHAGVGPAAGIEKDLNIFKRKWTMCAGIEADLLAVVVRPSYVLPFIEDGLRNVQLATLNDYGNYSTRVSFFRAMKNGNAMKFIYRWRYDFYSRENTVRHAMHSVSFILYFKASK